MLIMIAGMAGAGKSTAARLIMDAAPQGASLVKFADPIKNMMRVLGLSEEHIEGNFKNIPLARFGGKTSRQLQQLLGTEWGRDMVSHHIWVNQMISRLEVHTPEKLWVCDDLRFDVEFTTMPSWCETMGHECVTFALERDSVERKDTHISEQPRYLEWGIPIIKNNGSIPELWEAIHGLLKEKGVFDV